MYFVLRMLPLPVLGFAGQVLAESSAAENVPASPALGGGVDPMAAGNLWQLTFGLLLVLGLMIGLAWLLRRTGSFQVGGGGLRILGGLSLGSRERVVLLQVGDTQLLLGVAPGHVQTLHVLEQPLDTAAAEVAGGFAAQLARIMKGGGKT